LNHVKEILKIESNWPNLKVEMDKLEIINPNTEDGAILRTSTSRQQQDGDPIPIQRDKIKFTTEKKGYQIGTWLTLATPASGEFESQPLLVALKTFETIPTIKRVWFSVVNRGTRAEPLEYLLVRREYAKKGIQLLDAEGKISYEETNTLESFGVEYKFSKYNSNQAAEIGAVISARDNWRDTQTQLHSAEIKYARMGYWVSGGRPMGFMKVKTQTEHGRRFILEKSDNTEKGWFKKMFELSLKKAPKTVIVEEVNELGYTSGKKGKKLTLKQLDVYLRNPIYALVRNSASQQTGGKPVKIYGTPYLTFEQFNQINEGFIRIVEVKEEIKILKGKTLARHIKNVKTNDYPFRRYVLCPLCNSPLYAGATRNGSGKPNPRYHCQKNHRFWSINKATFDKTILEFTQNLKLKDERLFQFKKQMLGKLRNKLVTIQGTTILQQSRVTELEAESQKLLIQIEHSTLLSVQQHLEKKLASVENQKLLAMAEREEAESKQIDIRMVIDRVTYFLEHLEKGLLGIANPTRRAAAWSTVFAEPPTYDNLVSRTAKLRSHVELISISETPQSLNVGSKGLISNPLLGMIQQFQALEKLGFFSSMHLPPLMHFPRKKSPLIY